MNKRFYQLKKGEQFHLEGWDYMKIGFFTARTAHCYLNSIQIMPWEIVKTIKPNPNSEWSSPSNMFSKPQNNPFKRILI